MDFTVPGLAAPLTWPSAPAGITSGGIGALTVEAGPGTEIWLRISRIGAAWAMHAGTDGQHWSLARHFRLDSELPAQIGIVAQSPLGGGCTVRFEHLIVVERTLADVRDGT
jgi:hypothetical protein